MAGAIFLDAFTLSRRTCVQMIYTYFSIEELKFYVISIKFYGVILSYLKQIECKASTVSYSIIKAAMFTWFELCYVIVSCP